MCRDSFVIFGRTSVLDEGAIADDVAGSSANAEIDNGAAIASTANSATNDT
jgi:hypothetical protein